MVKFGGPLAARVATGADREGFSCPALRLWEVPRMKQYPVDKLRNVVLLGQGRSGKTSFAEAALFLTKGH